MRFEELMDFARDLHDFMRDHAKLTESEKPLIVSGTLIALRNKAFTMSYHVYSPEDLQKEWMRVIKEEIQKSEIPRAKKDNMSQPYSSIAVHPELGRATKTYPKGVLYELIKRLNEKVFPFISIYQDFDIVGQFYGEFLKYTGGDKKSLGIVLTPRHVTELFALLANVNKNSKVLDICAGTGGFLISAMHKMMKDTSTEEERDNIKKYGLIGVEQQPNMFALAASNMILRGDGKANLYQGSCFDIAITKAVKAHKCDVGMLNPPFSQGDADFHELYFAKHILDCLEKGATGIVITPMSCAISPHPARVELLKNHTLEAVMSMPDELFYPVGIITCIMVFTAKIPHITSNKKTWFGYWKEDGFVKTKHRGRIDLYERWESIQNRWIEMFRNREIYSGESVMQKVTPDDEWCAEAYMETDYSNLTKDNFVDEVKKYISFKLWINSEQHKENVAFGEWKYFCIGEFFEVKKGRRLTKANMTNGNTPFIGAIDKNNGVSAYIGQQPIFKGNTITVNYDGNGVAEAYYQPVPYWALDSVNVLYPKFNLTPAIAIFLISIIRQEKFRFNYGRKWHMQRMKESMIKLPAKINNEPDWEYMENYIKLLPLGNEI
ncbi:MAG: N-6 DNA methylase [Nostoc sp. NMS8]|nr:N-6 DNA methylase [Nostoc sp. NMS8]